MISMEVSLALVRCGAFPILRAHRSLLCVATGHPTLRAHDRYSVLQQARKEGEEDVVGKLEKVLSVAMEEKQKTLRPEIQLLNRLLGAKTGAERTAVRRLV